MWAAPSSGVDGVRDRYLGISPVYQIEAQITFRPQYERNLIHLNMLCGWGTLYAIWMPRILKKFQLYPKIFNF